MGLAKYYDWFAERLLCDDFPTPPHSECTFSELAKAHEKLAHTALEAALEYYDPSESALLLLEIIKAVRTHPSLYSKIQQKFSLIHQVLENAENPALVNEFYYNGIIRLKAAYGVISTEDLRSIGIIKSVELSEDYASVARLIVDHPEFYQYLSIDVLYAIIFKHPQIAQQVMTGESLYPGFADQLNEEQRDNLSKLCNFKLYQSQMDSQQPMHIEHDQTFDHLQKQKTTTVITTATTGNLYWLQGALETNENIRKVFVLGSIEPTSENYWQEVKKVINEIKQKFGNRVTVKIGPVINHRAYSAEFLFRKQTNPSQTRSNPPNPNLLYDCSSTSPPNNINDPARNNPNNTLNFKPLFEIDQPVNQQTLQVLKSMKRMALREVYHVDREGQLQPYQPQYLHTISPSHDTNTTDQHDITLRVINHESLQPVPNKHNCYFIPVLTPQQKLVTCHGGQIQQDELGRWLLFTDNAQQCQLTLSVPTQAPNQQIIDATNIDNTEWDNLPYTEQLRHFFNGTGEDSFIDCNQNNISCAERVKQLFKLVNQQNPAKATQTGVLYAVNDFHAFICIQTDNQVLKIDLGGSRSNKTYQYEQRPSSQHNNQATAHIPYELPELPSEYAPQNSTSTEQSESYANQKPLTNALIHNWFSEHEQAVRRWVYYLKQRCFSKNQIQQLNSEQSLTRSLTQSGKRVLLITSDSHQLGLKLLQKHRLADSCFYLQHPQQLDINQTKAQLTQNGDVTVNHQGFLGQFLEGASQSQEPYTLLIDWSQFTANQRTAINTLLDDPHRQLLGHKIPSNVTIVGLAHTLPEDRSFVSRHDSIYEVDPALTARNSNSTTCSQTITIDMAGLSRWQEGLLGQVKVTNNKPHWHKSELVNYLEAIAAGTMNADVQFKIINYPDDAQDVIQATLEQDQARGYLIYQGLAIEFPQQADFVLGEHNLDLSEFVNNESVHCQTDIQRHQLPENAHIINSQWFELLLHDQIIDNSGRYSERPGLIEQAADTNTPLALYITTPLDQTQWYNLCRQAKHHQVTLRLYLAPGVQPPQALNGTMTRSEPNHQHEPETEPCVYLTNNPDRLLKEEFDSDSDSYVFNLEDQSFQSLFYAPYFELTHEGFNHCQWQYSDVFKALQKGHNIILKGAAPKSFLEQLHPLIGANGIWHNGEWCSLNGQLTLLLETPELSHDASSIIKKKGLSWLSVADDQIYPYPQEAAAHHEEPIWQEPSPTTDVTAQDLTPANADAFLGRRIATVKQQLNDSPWLQLIGKTGVGKSSLMQQLSDEPSLTVYHDLSNLTQWAQDNSNHTKILFIDEANIEDDELVRLAGITNQQHPKCILDQGKLYNLDDNHRIVLARNPNEYGGGRLPQKLLQQYNIPIIELNDFYPSYIYDRLLKPIHQHSGLAETIFKDYCLKLINAYRHQQSNPQAPFPIRQLQDTVLQYCTEQLTDSTKSHKTSSSNFVLTPTNRPIYHQVKQFVDKKQIQQDQHIPANYGLNALLIQGESGTGKSALIADVLHQSGYQDLDCKIEASLPLSQQQERLQQAFHEGQPVWIDELNVCSSNGLEKTLNSVLTGIDPKTGKQASNPGFMVLATANEADLPGRHVLSPALQARCVTYHLSEPKREDIQTILQTHYPDAEVTAITDSVERLRQDNPDLNLRDILTQVDAVLKEQTANKPGLSH